MKEWEFAIGELVIVNEKAKLGVPLRVGELAEICELLTDRSMYDYRVRFKDGDITKIRETELDKPDKGVEELLMSIMRDRKAIHGLKNEEVKVLKMDLIHGQVEIKFEDGSMEVVGLELLRPINKEESEIKRKEWDYYFMDIAKNVATRATCDRLHVGCVIVQGKRIVSTGYNGSVNGQDHCDEVGHLHNEEGRCIRTIHAEQNAILFANREELKGATAYITHQPCENCAKLLVQSGIERIVFEKEYENKYSNFFLEMVEATHLEEGLN
ncbi:deoxycytidylate deaminase [Bacillus infantis]|uniref:deoxycytidylate deaminase n=1 Tax=Bacillus infantis TaxID=324767 RepID=UPI003CEE5965